jgi:hypothetical protein
MAAAAMAAATTSVSGEGVLIARFVAGIAYMALAIARFVSLEVVEPLRSTPRQRSSVAIVRVIAVVDVAVKAARAVVPGTGSEKDSADKPVGTIVAVGRTVVGRVVEVAVGASGLRPDTNANGDLG